MYSLLSKINGFEIWLPSSLKVFMISPVWILATISIPLLSDKKILSEPKAMPIGLINWRCLALKLINKLFNLIMFPRRLSIKYKKPSLETVKIKSSVMTGLIFELIFVSI